MLTQDPHIIFAFLLVLFNQVVKIVTEVLKERILLVHLQTQNTIEELSNGAVCRKIVAEPSMR